MKTQDRLITHLRSAAHYYPNAWALADEWRQDKGKDLPNWPDWCFFPMAGWYSAVCNELQVPRLTIQHAPDVARLAALGSWRYTQSIYRLHPDLQAALADTVPTGPLPVELLMRMPEWCVYIETTGMQYAGQPLHGFFAHLEWDSNTGRSELRLMLDTETDGEADLLAVVLHIGPWTITEAVDRAVSESHTQAAAAGIAGEIPPEFTQGQAQQIYPLASLLLYVCSDGVEYRAQHRPANPEPKRTRRGGWRLFPAAHPRIWNLGDKTGEALHQAAATERQQPDERKGPRPHIRRAHWHTFYAGPRDAEQRETRVKWIPPLPVAMPGDDD